MTDADREVAWQRYMRARMNVRYYEATLALLNRRTLVVEVSMTLLGAAIVVLASTYGTELWAPAAIAGLGAVAALIPAVSKVFDWRGSAQRHATMLARWADHTHQYERLVERPDKYPSEKLEDELARMEDTRQMEVHLVGEPDAARLETAKAATELYAEGKREQLLLTEPAAA